MPTNAPEELDFWRRALIHLAKGKKLLVRTKKGKNGYNSIIVKAWAMLKDTEVNDAVVTNIIEELHMLQSKRYIHIDETKTGLSICFPEDAQNQACDILSRMGL